MKQHIRKMIAPVVISILLVAYYIGFAIICALIPLPLIIRLLFILIPLALAGVMIYVLIQRIKEIRSGEEDDLSKY